MDSFNLSWRGQPHSGKRTALHQALKQLAQLRGIPFSIQTKLFFTGGASKSDTGQISTTAEEDGNDDGGSEKDSFPYEFSLLHIGFDISRMSMQDKIYLKPILQRWGTGSQVLAGNQGRGSRILVFYHAHLFSTESYFLLHSLLENNYGDISIWFTSELPVAERLSDYFIEIPVVKNLPPSPLPSWPLIFQKVLVSWSQKPLPILSETTEIRNFLYELLMRNLRWTDCVHYLLDVILELSLPLEKKKKVLGILAKQEATSAGQTIPSYRIPLLWEALFLEIREALSEPTLDGGPSSRIENTCRASQTTSETSSSKVVTRHAKSRGTSKLTKGSHSG
jgi:hypothetical protein